MNASGTATSRITDHLGRLVSGDLPLDDLDIELLASTQAILGDEAHRAVLVDGGQESRR